jgi:hypothetical protein
VTLIPFVVVCRFRAPASYAVDDVLSTHQLQQWTDAIYKIENTTFAKLLQTFTEDYSMQHEN